METLIQGLIADTRCGSFNCGTFNCTAHSDLCLKYVDTCGLKCTANECPTVTQG